jgi:hypothetical protein
VGQYSMENVGQDSVEINTHTTVQSSHQNTHHR